MSFAIVSNSARSATRCVSVSGRTTSSRTRRYTQGPSNCAAHVRPLSSVPQWNGQDVSDGAFQSAVMGVTAVSAALGYFVLTSSLSEQEKVQEGILTHQNHRHRDGVACQNSLCETSRDIDMAVDTGMPAIVATASIPRLHPSMYMSMFDEPWSGLHMALGDDEDARMVTSIPQNKSGRNGVVQLQYSSPGNATAAARNASETLSDGVLDIVEASVHTAHTWEKKAKAAVDKLTKTSRFETSVRALKGGRLSMEDMYCIHDGGRFTGVFDGHGGSGVSKFISESIYTKIKKHLAKDDDGNMTLGPPSFPTLANIVTSMSSAFDELEHEVLQRDEFQWQGSTAVAVYVHEDASTRERALVTANIGDSRAIMGKGSIAIDLTRDHKPDDELEKKRITDMGETVEWDEYCQVSRVKSLSLSRAVGDRFAKPVVSGEVEIQVFPLQNHEPQGNKDHAAASEDDFVLLASDGLWDVMTSQNCVNFVHDHLSPSPSQARNMSPAERQRYKISRRKNMSRYVANEATKRGSCDNICVIVVWLNEMNGGSGIIDG